jgi:hypothetical protein
MVETLIDRAPRMPTDEQSCATLHQLPIAQHAQIGI